MKRILLYRCLSALVLTSLSVPGCGARDAGPDAGRAEITADSAAHDDANPDAYAAEDVGTRTQLHLFAVSLSEACNHETGEAYAYATANGRFADHGEAPGERIEAGECVFFRPALPMDCDPQCEPGTVCDYATGECREPVPPVSASEITVSGLKSALMIIPETRYYYYIPHFDPEPANGDIFDEGTAITAFAPGGEVPAFQVTGEGVAAVETELPCELDIDASKDLSVQWTPGSQGDTIIFEMRSGNHANQFSSITCTASDSGELVVDSALLQEYVLDSRPVELRAMIRTRSNSIVESDYRIQLTTSASTSCSFWGP